MSVRAPLPPDERKRLELARTPVQALGPQTSGRELATPQASDDQLRRSRSLIDLMGTVANVGGWEFDVATGVLSWTDSLRRLHEVAPDYRPALDSALAFFAPEARSLLERFTQGALAHGTPWDIEVPLITAKGRRIWVRTVATAERDGAGRVVRLTGVLHDISAQRRMSDALVSNHEILQTTLASIEDAVITTDAEGCVTWLNPSAERLTAWSVSDAQGRPSHEVFRVQTASGEGADPVQRCLLLGRAMAHHDDTLLIGRDGIEHAIAESVAPVRREGRELLGTVVVFHDVSEQRRLNQEISHRARHDSLTGLLNRGELELQVRRLLEGSQRDGSTHCLLYVDLDQFKLVNDSCGHAIGDRLLREIALMLRSSVRANDIVARIGGDEFALVLEHCAQDDGMRVAQRICERLDAYRFSHDDRRFRVGASIGLVPVQATWSDLASLLQAADACCFAAKDAGRNRVHAWSGGDATVQVLTGEMRWARRIEQALDEDRFELFAQRIMPVVASASDGLHCEVLLRMREPDGSLVSPGLFLPAAERFNLATRIDRLVMGKVFDILNARPEAVEVIDSVAINISGQSLGDRAFHRHVEEMIATLAFDPKKLCFEVTETSAIIHLAEASAFIKSMRERGIRIALDDFGAGASSFGYLKSLPVDIIKIDGQFIVDFVEDALARAAVLCFRDVARVLGLKTVAEFVEREEVRSELAAIGIDYAQGYLMHRPEPFLNVIADAVTERHDEPVVAVPRGQWAGLHRRTRVPTLPLS